MTKMFQYLMKFEKEFEFLKENTATKADVDKIMTILDQYTQILQTHELERHALQAQVERDEKHIALLAEKAKLKLDYSV